ncbi:MAG TPA: hypothetical protein DEP05_09310 [Betaproteobacteria bacterium]|nr:hypothetical protein [Betaproteobacteria bacterium]
MESTNNGGLALQDFIAQLRQAFLDELPERLEELERLLLQLENNESPGEPFNEFYRGIHSIKGSGGTFGLHLATTICHQLEDYLNLLPGKPPKFNSHAVDICLQHIDLLRNFVEAIQSGAASFPAIEKKIGALQKEVLGRQEHTALILDNSKVSQNICSQTLENLGFRTVSMDDGYLALMRALTQPFDILITSSELKMLNGEALIAALRLSNSVNKHIKAIMLTSNNALLRAKKREIDPDAVIWRDANIATKLSEKVAEFFLKNKSPH